MRPLSHTALGQHRSGEFTTHFRTYFSGWIGMFTGATEFWLLTHGQIGVCRRVALKHDGGVPAFRTLFAWCCGLTVVVINRVTPKWLAQVMETWTTTCGPIPGGLILTHTGCMHLRGVAYRQEATTMHVLELRWRCTLPRQLLGALQRGLQ